MIPNTASRYLDGWRGLSAIVVLLAHGNQIFLPDGSASAFAGAMAAAAVMVFFGLSGFFIHQSLNRSPDLGRFIRARADRLGMTFLFAVFLTVALYYAAPIFFETGTTRFAVPSAREAFSLEGLLPTLVFLNGFAGPTLSANGPLWSLSYEVWYYALAGVAVCWNWRVALAALAILTILNPFFAIWGTIWAGGFALSALHERNRIPVLPAWPAALMAAVILLGVIFGPEHWVGRFIIVFELVFGAWFLLDLARRLRLDRFSEWPVAPWCARFSYTLYVIHFPLMLFLYGWVGAGVLPMIVGMVVAFSVAAMIGPWIEGLKPTAAVRRMLSPQSQ